MKQDEICDLLHIGRNTYGRWERGEVEITPSMNLLVHNLIERVPDARAKVLEDKTPMRYPLNGFPDVMIHAVEPVVRKHPRYPAAKSGDAEAAQDLVSDTINDEQVEKLRHLLAERKPILVSVHAYESEGVNAIPEAFADSLAIHLGLETDAGIVQTNVVTHTGADGYMVASPGNLFSKGMLFLALNTYWWMILSVREARWQTCAVLSNLRGKSSDGCYLDG
jgi:hypothetical protein